MLKPRKKIPFVVYAVFIIVVIWIVVVFITITNAHDAPTGWTYPYKCCSNKDCHPLGKGEWSEVEGGYSVKGKFFDYMDARPSPDGDAHICENPNNGYVIQSHDRTDDEPSCIFIPQGGF